MKRMAKSVKRLLKEQGHVVARSELEEEYYARLKQILAPLPEREVKFHPKVNWRFDFAWPDRMLAVEIEGGVWTGGRHTRGGGFIRDCTKYNKAQLAGWRVLRFTKEHLDSGDAYADTLEGLGWEVREEQNDDLEN